ncbi:unnamed protein product [Paramecium octaurelia]|uniref:Uncharacterized protein n=1 Tax=Paramecium octaurelia TaxID=43137 RepID=A0A8S1V6M5_PAROT|nr:unnamed protein product [Paramecium octaurelia]CAD8173022.1 unnamed protein product [Paramecium octaurelia]
MKEKSSYDNFHICTIQLPQHKITQACYVLRQSYGIYGVKRMELTVKSHQTSVKQLMTGLNDFQSQIAEDNYDGEFETCLNKCFEAGKGVQRHNVRIFQLNC